MKEDYIKEVEEKLKILEEEIRDILRKVEKEKGGIFITGEDRQKLEEKLIEHDRLSLTLAILNL